jgi:hypothetical protein
MHGEQAGNHRVLVFDSLRCRSCLICGKIIGVRVLHAVDDEPSQRHVIRTESIDKKGSFTQCIAFGCSDHNKRGALCSEKRVRLNCSLPEATEHGVDCSNKCTQVGEQLRAKDFVEHSRKETYSCTDESANSFASAASRGAQYPNKFPIKK